MVQFRNSITAVLLMMEMAILLSSGGLTLLLRVPGWMFLVVPVSASSIDSSHGWVIGEVSLKDME